MFQEQVRPLTEHLRVRPGYSWRNGELVPVREEWETEDPTVFPGSDCRFVRGLNQEKNGKLVETSRMRVDVGG